MIDRHGICAKGACCAAKRAALKPNRLLDMSEERSIQFKIREELGAEPDLCLFRNQTGQAKEPIPGGGFRYIPYGLCKGSSDLIGLLAPWGRFFALEVKAESGRLSPEQKQFLELIRKFGGFAADVWSVAEAWEALGRARKGLLQ